MKIRPLHSWDLSPREAIALQKKLAGRIDYQKPLKQFDLIAGADVSYNRFSNVIHAGVVVWRASDGTIVEQQTVSDTTTFPYVPGLLTFREAPAVLAACAKLHARPDVVMCDGQGRAHPRRIGLASHIGLWLGIPTLGCAKSRFLGDFARLPIAAGSIRPLTIGAEIVGDVVRTKRNVQPLYVSPGHKIDRSGAVAVVLASLRGYRIPEPTRQAHLYVNDVRRRAFSIP